MDQLLPAGFKKMSLKEQDICKRSIIKATLKPLVKGKTLIAAREEFFMKFPLGSAPL
jgi:hypothetical protein